MFEFNMEPGKNLTILYNTEKITQLVSIITPFYNSGHFFEQTYNSILNQSFPYFEWIIVNDGSTNEKDVELLVSLSQKDKRIMVIHTQNHGASSARNIAVSHSKTDIIIPIDADDLLEPTYVEVVYWVLICNTDISWVYTDSVGFGSENYVWQKTISSKTMKKANFMASTACAIRKKDFEDVGGYDDSARNMYEDWRFCLKLLASDKRPARVPQILFWYRRHKNGELYSIERNKKLKKKLKKEIRKNSKKISNNIVARCCYGNKSIEFQKPYQWDWNNQLPYLEDKIRILLIIPHMEMGGADKFNLDLISNIDIKRFSIGVLTTVYAENQWRQRFNKYIDDIFELPALFDMNAWCAFISYYIKTRNINIVLNSNSYFGYTITPWLRKEFPHIGIIDYTHIEETYWRAGGYPRISGVVDRVLDRSYSENEYTRKIMIQKYGKSESNVKTIYLGVDENHYNKELFDVAEIRKQLKIPLSSPVILYIGRITPQKRPFMLLEIAKRLMEKISSICFVIVGNGEQMAEFQQTIKRYKLQKNIFLVGQRDDPRPYYAISDLSLICSLKEGLTLSAFEAMSMSVPVISADVGGQSELIDESVGRLVPLMQDEKNDYDSRVFVEEEIDLYVDTMIDLIEDKIKLEQLKINCRKRIIEGFTLEQMVKTIENEVIYICQEKNREKMIKLSEDLQYIEGIIDDYVTLYYEFENAHVNSKKAQLMLESLKNLATFKIGPRKIYSLIKSKRNNPHMSMFLQKTKIEYIFKFMERLERVGVKKKKYY